MSTVGVYEITLTGADAAWETCLSGLCNTQPVGTTIVVEFDPHNALDYFTPVREDASVIVTDDGFGFFYIDYDDGGVLKNPDEPDYDDLTATAKLLELEGPFQPAAVDLPPAISLMLPAMLLLGYIARRRG